MWIDSHIWMKDHCLHQLYSCLCGFCDMIASFFFQEKKAKNQKTLLAPSRMYCMLQGIYIENTSSCVRNSRLQNVTMNIYLFKLFKWLECKASLAAFFLALSRKKKGISALQLWFLPNSFGTSTSHICPSTTHRARLSSSMQSTHPPHYKTLSIHTLNSALSDQRRKSELYF